MNTVIYARFSSHAQNEQSIEGQLHDCYEYARKNGLVVVGEYIDRALTGRSDDRPDFQRMIQDARKKQFQYVLVYKLDRFARNRYDSAIYKHKLKQCDVKVLSAMENIGDNPESIILEAVLEASAEYYSIDLSQKIKRGRRESSAKGRFVGGSVPIGYKTSNGTIYLDEAVAPAIKQVFEQYAAGIPKKQIIQDLNAKGYRNKKGKPYGFSAFQYALRSEKYIGVLDQCGNRIEGGCPALIDKETFYKVQQRLDENKRRAGAQKAKVEYLLSGKLFCGPCGSQMQGVSGTSRNGDKHYYYRCSNKPKKLCTKKNEKKDFLEWFVVEQTVEFVLNPERIKIIAEAVVAEYDREFGNNSIKITEKRLAYLDREASKIIDTMMDVPKEYRGKLTEKLQKISSEKTDLEIDLAKLKIANEIRFGQEEIVSWLREFCNGDPLDLDFRRKIIDVFINSIWLYDDKVLIYYNIKGGKQVSYIEVIDDVEGIEIASPCSYTKQFAPPNTLEYEQPLFVFGHGLFGILIKR